MDAYDRQRLHRCARSALEQARAELEQIAGAELAIAVLVERTAEQAAAIAVSGCESRTWLRSWQEEESLYLAGDSDSALIRGVLALLLSQIHGQPADVIKNFDFDEFLEGEGLWRELSPSRGNGLRAIIHAIRQLAAERERVF